MHDSNVMRDWADIRLFLAILDEGSLMAAAVVLGLTQPTVGRRLAALEQRFDTPLFVRTGRRMQLTDAGEGILESARRMEQEMLAIERSIEGQSRGLCGDVTISAIEGTGTDWLPPVLHAFHQQYPDIVLKVQIANRAVDLVHREADIALRLGRPAQGDLIARRLCAVGFGYYASPSYLEKHGAPNSEEELLQHEHVGIAPAGTRINADGVFPESAKQEGRYVYLTNSPAAQLGAVRAGFGIGLLSHRMATMNNELERVLPGVTPHSIDLWLVSHEELRHSARIRAVSDFIAERLEQDASIFEHGVL